MGSVGSCAHKAAKRERCRKQTLGLNSIGMLATRACIQHMNSAVHSAVDVSNSQATYLRHGRMRPQTLLCCWLPAALQVQCHTQQEEHSRCMRQSCPCCVCTATFRLSRTEVHTSPCITLPPALQTSALQQSPSHTSAYDNLPKCFLRTPSTEAPATPTQAPQSWGMSTLLALQVLPAHKALLLAQQTHWLCHRYVGCLEVYQSHAPP